MVSILIPTYNHSVSALILALKSELVHSSLVTEIIVADDASTQLEIKNENKAVCNNHSFAYIENIQNKGRTLTRHLLAQRAQYSWLLFLDADVLPKNNNFIQTYLNSISQNISCAYGGLAYPEICPNPKVSLRWKFGYYKEQIPVQQRLKSPYKSIASGNLLIEKELFLGVNKLLKYNWYGYDNFFSAELKKNRTNILHIDNPVYHLGLESNEKYLSKKEQAATTIFKLHQEGYFPKNHENGLLKAYQKLCKLGLVIPTSLAFKFFKTQLKKNILSKDPNLTLLNLYRLGYFCNLTNQ